MIQIARIYGAARKRDGWHVLVDRLWPRGIRRETAHVDLWMKDIAPSEQLRKWFGHEPEKWPEFQKRYRAELTQKKQLLAELKGLEKNHGTLTLLFGARDEEHNHAVVLLDILKKKT
jgi:uncharacterized protein YeaO (DUF488 family)